MNDTEKQFFEELHTLLKKYNADISVDESNTGYPEIAIYGYESAFGSFESFNITRKWIDGNG